MKQKCKIDSCGSPLYCRGWCVRHYQRWRAHGDPQAPPVKREKADPIERFWSKVQLTEKEDGCWVWGGTISKGGYGQFAESGRSIRAHRYSYEYLEGSIPEGMVLDHACRNRLCVRPHSHHVRLATPKQNSENIALNPSNKSGVRGVFWESPRQCWKAVVQHHKKIYFVGRFNDLAEAAEAARVKRNELFTHNILDRSE